MYDLTISMNTTTLANKELAKAIISINHAVETGNKSSWTVAEEFNRIIKDELFDDDFENEKQFADFVGVSKAYLSQCKRAVDFKENHPTVDTTVNKAYLFSTVDLFEDFQSWVLDTYNAQPWEFSDKAVRDLIKEYNNKDVVEEETDDVVEEETDDVVDAMDVMVEVYDTEGTKYIVPISVINQYRVEA